MSNSYLVLDIETVPDRSLWSPQGEIEIPKIVIEKNPSKESITFLDVAMATIKEEKPIHRDDLEKATDIARRSKRLEDLDILLRMGGDKKEHEMAPAYAQIPIAIGCVWLDQSFQPKKIGCLKNSKGLEGEKQILSEWNEFAGREKPNLITWYGRGFDLPVLMLRSFRHGINMNWYFNDREYRYRYSEQGHADLCDAMGDFGAIRGLKLSDIARAIGLPGKHDNMDGSQVASYFEAGKIDEICTYCTDDTVQTSIVFLRWQLTKGRISIESYKNSIKAILGIVESMPDLKKLREGIKDSALLLE